MKLLTTSLKYHSWYLCQILLQIMLLPILIIIIITIAIISMIIIFKIIITIIVITKIYSNRYSVIWQAITACKYKLCRGSKGSSEVRASASHQVALVQPRYYQPRYYLCKCMWVEFVVISLLCSERFFSRYFLVKN